MFLSGAFGAPIKPIGGPLIGGLTMPGGIGLIMPIGAMGGLMPGKGGAPLGGLAVE